MHYRALDSYNGDIDIVLLGLLNVDAEVDLDAGTAQVVVMGFQSSSAPPSASASAMCIRSNFLTRVAIMMHNLFEGKLYLIKSIINSMNVLAQHKIYGMDPSGPQFLSHFGFVAL